MRKVSIEEKSNFFKDFVETPRRAEKKVKTPKNPLLCVQDNENCLTEGTLKRIHAIKKYGNYIMIISSPVIIYVESEETIRALETEFAKEIKEGLFKSVYKKIGRFKPLHHKVAVVKSNV
jgi:hypothetical protein